MTDELTDLRSFRPEATGPSDSLTLEARSALMDVIAAEPLPHPAGRRRKARLFARRRVRVALVFVGAVVVVGSVAAAAGLIPDDVKRGLGLASDMEPALHPNVDQAVKRASVANPAGGTVELWTAPTKAGGTCAYLRHLDASGDVDESGGVGLTYQTESVASSGHSDVIGGPNDSGDSSGGSFEAGYEPEAHGLGLHIEWGFDQPLAVYGNAPKRAAQVAVMQTDGTVTTGPVTENGWYLIALDEATDPGSLKTVEARAASGETLGSIPLEDYYLGGDVPPPSG